MIFRKSNLALACCLAAGNAAAAVSLDPHGLGQGLLYPYFTTNNDQTTLVNVQNATSDGKALKVRILESAEGHESTVFNVYLPPFGQWGAALSWQGLDQEQVRVTPAAGNAGCILAPGAVYGEAFDFMHIDYRTDFPGRRREGSIEIIEMGTLDAELRQLVTAGSEADCFALDSRAAGDGIWMTDEGAGIEAPKGGLRGSAVIVNATGGTTFEYPALGFNGLASTQRHNYLRHCTGSVGAHVCNVVTPRLTDIQPSEDGTIAVNVMSTNGIETLRYPAYRGHDAIGALLATTQALNTFNIQPGLRSRTEWLVSFPTRNAHVGASYVGTPDAWDSTVPFADSECESVPVVAWNTKGTRMETNTPVPLCRSTDVIRFVDTPEAEMWGSALMADWLDPVVITESDEGAVRLDFRKLGENGVRAFAPDLDDKCVLGLPAWVMAVQSFDNDNARGDRIATYPVSNLASGPVEVVDCDGLPD